MTNKLIDIIEKYDTIAIFRHAYPDGDALGSQYGLKQFIVDKYPTKKVVALGARGPAKSSFPASDTISDSELTGALAIVLDTANTARIDDQRYQLCQYVLKVDHHPEKEVYGDMQMVDDQASATCELLTSHLIESLEVLSSACATYLYCGLIADTQQFSISSTSSKTLACAAYLCQFKVDVSVCNTKIFSATVEEFNYETKLRSQTIIRGNMAYIIATQEDYEACGVSFEKAKEKVFVLSKVVDFKIYCLFTETSNGVYQGSLRSNSIVINDIAEKYQGGGHLFACGVKDLTLSTIEQLMNDLEERLLKQ